MKPNLLKITVAVLFILAALTLTARAAGPATNVVTLAWDQPAQVVPYYTEVQQTLSLVLPNWIVLTNVPSTSTNLTLTIDKDLKFWRVRNINSTNTAWASDFSNVASTLWPVASGNLSIRLGP